MSGLPLETGVIIKTPVLVKGRSFPHKLFPEFGTRFF